MKHLSIILVFGLLLFVAIGFAGDHAYTGLKKCKMCHKGEAKGNIYETWEASLHAKAFTALGEDKAKEVYTKLGKEGNPQEDPACLKCHVTGFGADSSLVTKVIYEDGITCEACHGAGGDYWKKTIMEDTEQAVANGMVADPKTGCVNCHNEESPTYQEFKFEERWEKIKHGLPE